MEIQRGQIVRLTTEFSNKNGLPLYGRYIVKRIRDNVIDVTRLGEPSGLVFGVHRIYILEDC